MNNMKVLDGKCADLLILQSEKNKLVSAKNEAAIY